MAFIPAALAAVGSAAGASAATAAATGAMIVGSTAAVAGAGVSAYGMIQQGKAQKREADYNAAVQENNAISAGYAAIQETQNAQREANQVSEARLRNLASQRTAAAASGLMLSGSVTDVLGDSALAAEKEIQLILHGGQIGAYNQTQRAADLQSQARMSRVAGANARRGAYYQAAGTLLSSAASIGSNYATFKKG